MARYFGVSWNERENGVIQFSLLVILPRESVERKLRSLSSESVYIFVISIGLMYLASILLRKNLLLLVTRQMVFPLRLRFSVVWIFPNNWSRTSNLEVLMINVFVHWMSVIFFVILFIISSSEKFLLSEMNISSNNVFCLSKFCWNQRSNSSHCSQIQMMVSV